MKLKAALELWKSLHSFPQDSHRISTRKIRMKSFHDEVINKFSTIWGRLASFSSYLMRYTSLTFFIFCLDKGVHFTVLSSSIY